ncbi:MAG: SPFH domain-containing protein [Bacteroidota bacterium]
MNFIKMLIGTTLLLCLSTSCVTINQGEVGVKRVKGVIDNNVLLEGRTQVNPFNTTVFRIPTRTVNLRVKLPLPSKEGLTIQSEISILYHVDPSYAPKLLKEVGMNFESQLISPVFRSATADVSSRFYAKDMHSGARSTIEEEIKTRMNKILAQRGIILDNVLMKSIMLPQGLTQAIEQKLEAEQEAQRMEFVKQQQQADSERAIIEAKGERDAQILSAEAEKRSMELRAEAKANATKLQADAEAHANVVLKESLSEEVLKYRAIEAIHKLSSSPNSKLIVNPGGTSLWGLPAELLESNNDNKKIRKSN